MTKVALAMAVDLAPRTITQYERGAQVPRDDTLGCIAAVLQFPEVFFTRDDPDSPDVESASFRAVSRMSARTRDQALSLAAIAMDLAHWIDRRFTTATPHVPQFPQVPPSLAAAALRREWDLGEAPLPHTIDLVEAHGIRVFSLPQDLVEVDANSFWRDGCPFVLLNRSKSTERSRFDIAHELGHLTMHDGNSAHGKQAEKEANEFAAALMMPEADVAAYTPTAPTLAALTTVKRRWGVSLAALTHRLRKLNLLSEWQYRALFIDMSSRGYRTNEPNGLPPERSQLIDSIIEICAQMGVTPYDIAQDLSIPVKDLTAMIFGFDLVIDRPNKNKPVVTAHPPDLRVID